MKIKKFKNGKIKLELEKSDHELTDHDTVYHDDMFFSDLYIDTINGDYIIIDYNTSIIYDYFNSYMLQNPLKTLIDDIFNSEKGYIYLYPSFDININTIDSMQDQEY